jgi:hypothetical protein
MALMIWSVIAAPTSVVVRAVMLMADVAGGIITAVTGLRDPRSRDSRDSRDRQERFGVPMLHGFTFLGGELDA